MSTALLGALAVAAPSLAGVSGVAASSAQSVGSGSWAAVATSAGSAPFGTGALSLNFGLLAKQVIYFNIANAGTLTLTGATYTLSAANLPTGASVTVYACVGGTWIQSTNSCSGGTITQIVSSTGSASVASVSSTGLYPQAAGGVVQVVAFLSSAPRSTSTATFSVSLSRTGQVRAATTTNS